jgi:hypothetical protein
LLLEVIDKELHRRLEAVKSSLIALSLESNLLERYKRIKRRLQPRSDLISGVKQGSKPMVPSMGYRKGARLIGEIEEDVIGEEKSKSMV